MPAGTDVPADGIEPMTEKQIIKSIKALARGECANYQNGMCLETDQRCHLINQRYLPESLLKYDQGSGTVIPTPEPEPEKPTTYKLGERVLKLTSPNMQGDDVKELQIRLNKLGFECGAADGIFGKKTLAGVKAFQLAHNLTVDGKFGSASFAALNGSSTEQTYTTVRGDTLWKISKKFLGEGSRYKEIMAANDMTSTLIRPGMELKIPM